MSQWVRLWEDMPTDPKWRVVARRSRRPVCEVISVFVFMMTNAGSAQVRGVLSSWDDESVAIALDMEEEHVAAIRQAMQGKVLDGETLMGWERRQPKREDASTDRVNAFRERQAAMKRNETQRNARPNDETLRNAPEEKREEAETEKSPPPLPSAKLPRDGHKAGGGDSNWKTFEKGFPWGSLMSRKKAREYFDGLTPEDQATAIACLPNYRATAAKSKTTNPTGAATFLAERLFENFAVPDAYAHVVTVEQDSAAGRAWDANFRHSTGKPPPWTNGRWYFPTEWPPDVAKAEAAA